MANAATQVSGLELGGLFGSLSSGAISDHLVRNNDGSKGNVGLRVQARRAPRSLPRAFACISSFHYTWPLHPGEAPQAGSWAGMPVLFAVLKHLHTHPPSAD